MQEGPHTEVQGLLSSRDEQGDTLLDLAITGARSGPAQPGYSELVRLLTAEGAPEAVAEGPAHELRADEVKRPSPTEAVADEGAGVASWRLHGLAQEMSWHCCALNVAGKKKVGWPSVVQLGIRSGDEAELVEGLL